MIIINDRFAFKDEQKAKAFKQSKSAVHALTVAANSINARKLSDKPYVCKTCNKPLEWILTKSKLYGQIGIVTTDCERCRLINHFIPPSP